MDCLIVRAALALLQVCTGILWGLGVTVIAVRSVCLAFWWLATAFHLFEKHLCSFYSQPLREPMPAPSLRPTPNLIPKPDPSSMVGVLSGVISSSLQWRGSSSHRHHHKLLGLGYEKKKWVWLWWLRWRHQIWADWCDWRCLCSLQGVGLDSL